MKPSPHHVVAARPFVMCALVVAAWLACQPAAAADDDSRPLQLEVFINDTPTDRIGTFALLADQKLAATRGELAEIGVNAPGNGAAEDTIVIDAASGIEYRYDEPSQRIYFKLGDERRVRQQYDARGNVDAAVQPKPDFGAVMNYTLFGGVTKSIGPGFTGFSGANASLDARVFGPYGTLTQTGIVGSTTLRDMDVLRLDTRWTYSDPDNLVSYRAGDTISGGLAWTRPIRLGGLQVQRNFALRPDLVTLPLPSYSGSAAVPSTVDVYVNNIKALSQPVAAGPYQISNLPLLSGGGTARVVVQDAAGREVEASLPYFISPTLLRQGLTDYTLEAGFPRLNYATQSNDYLGKPAASGGVRHGLYDWLTLEAHGEAGAGVLNAGTGLVASLASWGVVSVAGSASHFDERFGYQAYAAFDTHLWGVTIHAGSQRTFGAYSDLSSAISRYLPQQASILGSFLQSTSATSVSSRPPKALDTISVGIPLPFDKSSLNFSFIRLEMYDRKRSEIMNVSYSRPLIWDATVHVTAFTDLADRKNSGIFAGISVPLGEQISGSSGVNSTGGRTNGYVDIAKTMQPEPGSYGWRVRDSEGANPYRNASATYRSSVAQFGGEVRQVGSSVGGSLQAQGAVAAMEGGVFLSNRIDDAFAVVDAGLADIEVLYENRPVGKTNSAGKILIPGLRSYQKNQVAIDPRDLPINAEAPTTQNVVAPMDRGGVVVRFGAKNANDTAMVILTDKDRKPLAVGSRVRLENSEETFVVGYDGQAYLKGLGATNTALVTTDAGECRATFPFTPDKDSQVLVGPVVCQ
jgi:outer membrane usher protein